MTDLRSSLSAKAPIRVGLIGAGVFGGYHAWKIHDRQQEKADVIFTALMDANETAATPLAAKMNVPVFATHEELFEACDAVVITAPARDHGRLAIAALEAGCHVFVEKPVALSLEHADQMINLALEASLTLQVGHQERYVVMALGLLDLPVSPNEILCVRSMPATGRGEDVSVVMDLMIHDLDLANQFLRGAGDLTLETSPGSNNDHVVAVINGQGEEGQVPLIRCEASRRAATRERSLTLIYDTGELHLDFLTRTITNTTEFTLKAGFNKDDGDNDNALPSVLPASEVPLAVRDPLAFGFDKFVEAIQTGQVPIVSGEDGYEALALAMAIEASVGIGTGLGIQVEAGPDGEELQEVAS